MSRNEAVAIAVDSALSDIEKFISGHEANLPPSKMRREIDSMINDQRGSVRTASLFLLYYLSVDPTWDGKSIPIGTRGQHGDKRLCNELSRLHITLHNQITAFGENLGWKGNVREYSLSSDSRFQMVKTVYQGSSLEHIAAAKYLAYRFAESRVLPSILPAVGADVLTFQRARSLFTNLIHAPSEGHIPQFVVAALLCCLRSKYGFEIVTHHPHAADKFDGAAGDIEERLKGELVRAYEVTVRPDWQNRISDFKSKMDAFGLSKYVIIASSVNKDTIWSQPAASISRLEPYGRDIAVVDIDDFINVLCAELSAQKLRAATNKAFEFLQDPKLCGRPDIIQTYRAMIEDWLDDVG